MVNGIINVYKEAGYTSHDVVAKLRGILKQKKIGHTGTLDPQAQGVLPVCLGKATKLCEILTDKGKTYVATMLLGIVTDTQDTTGTVIRENPVLVSEEQARSVILSYQGSYEQTPPMYSALKVNGKKLYELAREGIEIERKERTVQIHSIHILEMNLPLVKIEVACSKGTYIRTLCHDIGQELGCGACMKELLRTRAGNFNIEESIKLDEIQRFAEEGRVEDYIRTIDEMFTEYDKLYVKKQFSKILYNGNPFGMQHCTLQVRDLGQPVRVYNEEKQFVGIYQWNETKQLFFPVKIFWETN